MRILSLKLLAALGVIGVILVLVIAHELGHFLAAKACKMRVEEFAVGFGSKKFTVANAGGTEYNIRPIPAGGFVRIAGMDPSEESPPDGFNSKSVWQRMFVIFAGPLASFLFAYILFCSLGMTVGLPLGDTEPTVVGVQAGSPAAKMGLEPGDRFVEIAGVKIETGNQMMKLIRENPGKKIPVVIEREGKQIKLSGTPRPTPEKGETVGKFGFNPGAEMRRVGFVESMKQGTHLSFSLVQKLISVIFSKQITKEAGGPIAIISTTHQAAEMGIAHLIVLTAGLSLNFAVLNLLPIPVLDGGLLMLLGVEVVRGRRLSAKTQQTALAIGMATLAVIVVLVLVKDISSLSIFAR